MVDDMVVEGLRLELAQAEDVLAEAADAMEALPVRWRRRLTRRGLSVARLRRAAMDAHRVLMGSTNPPQPPRALEVEER